MALLTVPAACGACGTTPIRGELQWAEASPQQWSQRVVVLAVQCAACGAVARTQTGVADPTAQGA